MSRRLARAAILSATCGLFPMRTFFVDPPQDTLPGGGGGAPPKKEEPPKKEDEPKLSMTKAELDAMVAAAVKGDQEARQKQIDEDKAKADLEDKKKRGEFEGMYAESEQKRTAAEQEKGQLAVRLRKVEVAQRLRDYVAEKHKEYADVAAEFMVPLLNVDSADLKDEDADKQIADIVKRYVDKNPRANKGLPPIPGRTGKKAPAANAGVVVDDDDETAPANGSFPSYMEG